MAVPTLQLLDKHCVSCHSEKIKDSNGGSIKPPRLDSEVVALSAKGWMNKTTRYTASYVSLAQSYGFTSYGARGDFNSPKFYRTYPGKFGARASRLYQMLAAGHHNVELSSEDMERVVIWLDSVSQFYSVYEKEGGEVQLHGGIATPTLY